jgi:hypothetical protein
MGIYGISTGGVISELGALGRNKSSVKESSLVKGLALRFDVSDEEAIIAINKAIEYKAIIKDEENNYSLRKPN